MSTTSEPRPRRRPVAPAAAVLAALVTLVLSGCGLRLETPDPTEPSPDAAETLRSASVQDALALSGGAEDLTTGTGPADPAVAAVLTRIRDAATVHAEQLGGVYDSGLPQPTPTPTTSAAPFADATELLSLLGSTAVRARADALSAPDAPTARLLASIAAARAQQAVLLAGTLGAEVPALAQDDAETPASDPSEDGSGAGPSASPGAADGSGSGDGSATSPATGLDRDTVTALVAAEDQAGYGYEVAAARLSDDARATAVAAAHTHRARAEEWARSAQIADTAQDPRRVAYDLGGTPADTEAVRAFCAGLEQRLAEVHADAVLTSGAGSAERTLVVDRLRESALTLIAWGGTATDLPGMAATDQAEPATS